MGKSKHSRDRGDRRRRHLKPPESTRGPTVVSSDEAGGGRLVVVATPIGNLGDLSPRAREALASADLIACEDTRRTGMLLAGLGLAQRPSLVSLHDHNERRRLDRLSAALAAGQTVALVSDAGTPLLSDPGFLVVRAAAELGFRIEAVPGPSALLAALVVAGLPAVPFTFAGFVPPRQGARRRFYAGLAALPHTLVVYEAPHRILASLTDASEVLGDRRAALSRELTKLHEETLRGTLVELGAELAARPVVKGELVLVIAGTADPGPVQPQLEAEPSSAHG